MDGTRLLFVGTTGSGKTTTARRAAALLGIRHIELDSIRHRENWVEMPDEDFRRAVAEIVAGPDWIIDGNYAIAREIAIPRATQVVWIDTSKPRVMAQIFWRSLSRAITRTELWNGNREEFSYWVRADHPIRWAWKTHADRRRRFEEQMTDKWARLRNQREIDDWLMTLKR